jgi:hypothetical protein
MIQDYPWVSVLLLRISNRKGRGTADETREEAKLNTEWRDHPLVQRAVIEADKAGDLSTLGVLDNLLTLMNEIEDRFPGIPFRDLLQDRAQMHGTDIHQIRKTLRRFGACEADIAIVCPLASDPDLLNRRAAIASDPYHEFSVPL